MSGRSSAGQHDEVRAGWGRTVGSQPELDDGEYGAYDVGYGEVAECRHRVQCCHDVGFRFV